MTTDGLNFPEPIKSRIEGIFSGIDMHSDDTVVAHVGAFTKKGQWVSHASEWAWFRWHEEQAKKPSCAFTFQRRGTTRFTAPQRTTLVENIHQSVITMMDGPRMFHLYYTRKHVGMGMALHMVYYDMKPEDILLIEMYFRNNPVDAWAQDFGVIFTPDATIDNVDRPVPGNGNSFFLNIR